MRRTKTSFPSRKAGSSFDEETLLTAALLAAMPASSVAATVSSTDAHRSGHFLNQPQSVFKPYNMDLREIISVEIYFSYQIKL